MSELKRKGSLVCDIVLPTTIWLGTVLLMLNLKNIPVEFIQDNHVSVRNYLAKLVLTILIPLGLIHAVYRGKSGFGIQFPHLLTPQGFHFEQT